MQTTLKKIVSYFYPSVNEEETEIKIQSAFDAEKYSEVIELVSQLNWQKKPISSAAASHFLRAYYFSAGTDDSKAMEFADLFIGFYGHTKEKNDFKLIKARIYEADGDSKRKNFKYEEAIKTFDVAYSWIDGNKSYPKTADRIKEKRNEAKAAWDAKLEKERKSRIARANFHSRSLTEFPELNTVINPLSKAGIETVGDLESKSNVELDKINGISDTKMAILSKFKSDNNL